MCVTTSILKKIIASVFIYGSFMNMSAQTIKSDISSACPGEAVEFTQTGFSAGAIYWQRYDGTKWVNEDQIKSTSHFVIDMGYEEMKIRATDASGSQVSNEVTITRSTNCKNSCMISSTGDYITGTDFDRKDPSQTKPAVPSGVESFFSDYNVDFSNSNGDYFVTQDLGSTFNGQYPILDKGEKNNSYYVFSNNISSNSPFTYKYPCRDFHDQNYRLVMRMYVMKKANCTAPSAKFKLETKHGEQTMDRAVMKIYDNDNQLIREQSILRTYGEVNLGIENKYAGQLLRIDFTFYGYFPGGNDYHEASGDFNGLSHYTMTPLFQQFDGCYTVAIDYLSAEVENVCLSPQMVCAGTTATTIAHATGFDSEAEYKWEIKNKDGVWESVGMGAFDGKGDAYRQAVIPVTRTGKILGRVIVKSQGFLANGQTQKFERIKEFTVTGKDCDPIYPDKINGPDLICTPDNANIYSVEPVDDDEGVFYRWTLKTPSGKVIQNSTVYQDNNEVGVQSVNVKGSSIKLYLPSVSEHGKYTLSVQVVERDGNVDIPKGQPVTRTINVHNTPVTKLTLSGNYEDGMSESDKTLCPADITTKVMANVSIQNKSSDHRYVYTWTGANGSSSSSSAEVSWDRAAACSGTATRHTVSVKTEIEGVGCPTTATSSYRFEKPVKPTIDCRLIDGSVVVLGEKEKTTTIDLPLPLYTASCDPDPKMTIDVVVKDLDGNKLTGSNQSRTITFSMSQAQTINKKVVAPAGTVEVTYSIKDGCDNVEKCDAVITVVDNTPPNIDCSKIKNYTAYLSKQEGCSAVPGYYPTELPKIQPPALIDLNGVDGTIIGTYMGRLERENEPAMTPASFSIKKKLNDEYNKGKTWILWEFSDKSGNVSYCLQSVTVEDDKKPKVTCPSVDDLGSVDVDTLTCTLKPSSVIAKIKELSDLPYGYDECSAKPTTKLVPTLYYRNTSDGVLVPIADSELDEPIFEANETYELVWVFKKLPGSHVDETISVECAVAFKPMDQDPPEFDCSTLSDIIVYPNWIIENNEMKYDDYASGAGQKGNTAGKNYTLAEYFTSGALSMHDDVIDVCGGKVTVDITITSPDGKIKTPIKSIEAFKTFKFEGDKAGKEARNYTIKYTFIDLRGNSKSCEHIVSVVRNAPPVPDCPTTPVELFTDDKCKVVYNLISPDIPTELSDIPTANVRYYHETRYGRCVNDKCNGDPITVKDGGMIKIPFGEYERSTSQSGFKDVTVYPDSVRLYDANGNVYTEKNALKKDDKVLIKDVTYRAFGSGKDCQTCAVNVPFNYAVANLSNFNDVPAIVKNYNLPVGKNTYVWYFSNAYDKTDPASKVLVDSCVVTVVVKDTISPKLNCPWDKPTQFYADETCELSQAEVNVEIPSIEDWASDNCTSISDLKSTLSWVRTFNSVATTDLSEPYKVGLTKIDWIVTDASGNSSICSQLIEVLDTIGPKVNCDEVTPPLTAYADANCEAGVAAVIKAGLQTPEIDDDICSPIGSRIEGVGERSDGKDVFKDAYPKGVTTITWKFYDASHAFSVCKQTITVKDTMSPTFDCREIQDTTVALAPDKCELTLDELLAAIGEHTAVDNCDGDIKGKPMLRLKDNTDIALPSNFRKDSTFHIVWHFIDMVGNDKTCDQYLTVADTTPPDASDACEKLKDSTIVVKVDCEIPFADLNVSLKDSIVDKCDGVLKAKVQAFVTQFDKTVVRYDDEEIAGVKFPIGTHKFLYIYTDSAGLSDTCIMYRTIEDGIPPVILDCFDGQDTVKGNVSANIDACGLSYEDLKDLFIMPKAYDKCDDMASGDGTSFIDPIVKRYVWKYSLNDYELVVDGNDNEEWKIAPFEIGLHKLEFIFNDKSGNTSTCIKYVRVFDERGPVFDCSKIDPNPYYPEALPGECSVAFGDIFDKLGPYNAVRYCIPEDEDEEEIIPGVLTLFGTDKRPDPTFELKVGRDYHLLWVFRSKRDGKAATCDQIIRPNHKNKLNPICDNAADIDTIKATPGQCFVPGDQVITKFPYAVDTCTQDTIWGVPHRSDLLEITDPFPTGHTHITWTMVSPYNISDTAICEQDVNIKGNKEFELNCEELTPTMHKIVAGCDSVYLGDTLDIPYVEDPCADPDSSYYMRPGHGVRSDNPALDPIADKYPLGPTVIRWTFWDFTHSVKDSCDQLVDVRTEKKLEINCDSINKDTLFVPVAVGECSVDAADIKDSLIKRGYPVALHPCGLGSFVGTPTRPNGMTMDDPFYVGPNEIIWVFIDSTTHTLVDSVVKCTQIVRVGDVNEPPVDCSQMPDTLVVLNPNDCDIEFSELGLNIKPVYDLCSGAHIDSVVTRASLPGLSSETPGVDILSYPFNVGVDTVYWKYNFGSYNFLCTQVIQVKDAMEPVVDCDTILDETIVLPENICVIKSSHVLDSIKQPYAYEFCTREIIKGVPMLMTLSAEGDTILSELPEEFKVGDPYKIAWVFADTSLSVVTKICDIDLTIMSSTKPKFDCDQFKDTVKIELSGVCDVKLDDQVLPIPQGEDACVDGYVVYGKGYNVDTVEGKPTYTLLAEMNEGTPSYKLEKLQVGVYKIAWVFESKYSIAKDTCVETLNILTDTKMEIACVDLPSFPPTGADSCTIDVTLTPPVALNPCTGDTILPDTVIRSDKKLFKGENDTFYVGKTTVYWIYVDHSKTLIDSIDTCAQVIQVGDVKKDPIQCPNDTLISLPIGVCQLDPAIIDLNDSTPHFIDFCTDTIVPLLKVWRASGLAITSPFELGIDTIFREYFYHGQQYICEQIIKVRSSAIDSFDCKMLGDVDPIVVELRTAANTAPFSEVERLGFKRPLIHNECNNIDTVYTRSDGLKLTDPYPLGETTITFVISDTTPGLGESKTCTRVVNVINTAAPGLNCPPLAEKKYICYKDLPGAYPDLKTFLDSGGFVLDVNMEDGIDLIDSTSFKVETKIYDVTNTEVTTMNLCEFTMIYKYSAVDLRGQAVSPCSDTFKVKDDVAPYWIDDNNSTIIHYECNPVFAINGNVKAEDGCWDKVYDTPVEKTSATELKDGIFYIDSIGRSKDPSDCDYYSYKSGRFFVAYDGCGNHSDTLKYYNDMRDTTPPVIKVDNAWNDTVIMADYIRPCIFVVPNIDSLFPAKNISDDCYPEAVKHYRHWQEPEKGKVLDPTKGNIIVTLYIEDVCHNVSKIEKEIYVPTKESIVSVDMHDDTVCVGDRLTIDHVRTYGGMCYYFNPNTGEWEYSASIAWFDYYKGKVDDDHMIYSTSQKNAWKFEGKSINDCLALDSHYKSDTFYIIVTDTVRFCSDTAFANITINDVPWVSLAPDVYNVCENDSLHLQSEEITLYDKFDVHLYDMGDSITKQGWMLGDSIYEPETPVLYSDTMIALKYFAINGCGTGLSGPSIGINTVARMNPENLMLVTDPQDKPRVFRGENATIKLVSKYRPLEYQWYKVNGAYDGRYDETFDSEGHIKEKYIDMIAEPDEYIISTFKGEKGNNVRELSSLEDTASYYVLMLDSICPAVPSNVVSINVVKELPTAFTPTNSIGLNDVFMEGYPVVIFNRYGQKIFEGKDGWDGTCRGELVDPGVYFYEIILRSGEMHKGSIEVVYFK